MNALDTMTAEMLLREMGFSSTDPTKETWEHKRSGWLIQRSGGDWGCYENGCRWGASASLAGALHNFIERAAADRQALRLANHAIKRFEALKPIFELGVEAARELFE